MSKAVANAEEKEEKWRKRHATPHTLTNTLILTERLTFACAVAEAEERAGRRLRLGRIPVFATATRLTALVLQHAPAIVAAASRAPGTLWRARKAVAATLLVFGIGVVVLCVRAAAGAAGAAGAAKGFAGRVDL